MNHLLIFLGLERRTSQQMGRLCFVGKVVSVACMVQSAVLFALYGEKAQWFQHTTLSIFIITTLAFTAVNAELFVEVGVYTVPAALTLLIIAVIQPGSQRKELLPWLPLFFAAVNIITLAVGKFNERARARPRPSTLEDGLGDVPFGTWSSRSSPERSTTPGMSSPQPSESASHGPAMYGRYGPPSQCSHRTGDSEMSLSDGPGCCRPAWDPATLSFFPGHGILPAPPTSGPWESAGLAAIHGFDAPELDLVSEASAATSRPAATSRQPLLGEEPNT